MPAPRANVADLGRLGLRIWRAEGAIADVTDWDARAQLGLQLQSGSALVRAARGHERRLLGRA